MTSYSSLMSLFLGSSVMHRNVCVFCDVTPTGNALLDGIRPV